MPFFFLFSPPGGKETLSLSSWRRRGGIEESNKSITGRKKRKEQKDERERYPDIWGKRKEEGEESSRVTVLSHSPAHSNLFLFSKASVEVYVEFLLNLPCLPPDRSLKGSKQT